MSAGPSVLVIGGGLAGLAAAFELADAGMRVSLVEKRPFLGGRTFSFLDRGSGMELDNGQHVFLGCCTQYIRFLKRLGVYRRVYLQPRLRVQVIDKVWGKSLLTSAPLPPPFHLLPSLLGYRSLSAVEKALAVYALAHLRALDRGGSPDLDGMTFEEWLRRHRQSPHAIRSLWNLVIQATLNEDAARCSADLAVMVLQEGFLRRRQGANVGWARVGLSRLVGEASRRYIEERGGEVRLREGLEGLRLEDGRVAGARLQGGVTTADFYVLALPPQAMLAALPGPLREDPFFGRAARIEMSPIVNVHLWYDRPVWDGHFAAFLNTPLQWAFNKSRLWGQEGDGQYIDISLSSAHAFIGMPGREIISLFQKEMQALFPLARGAVVRRALVTRQRDATFAPRPGIARLRLAQRTPVENLFLAGDWTDTGWPATMEGAVRSGLLAAREVLRCLGRADGKEVIAASALPGSDTATR